MGFDYYEYCSLIVLLKSGDTEYIQLSKTGHYYPQFHYDSDNEDYNDIMDVYMKGRKSTRPIYEKDAFVIKIKSMEKKYLDILRENNINIEDVYSIVKEYSSVRV